MRVESCGSAVSRTLIMGVESSLKPWWRRWLYTVLLPVLWLLLGALSLVHSGDENYVPYFRCPVFLVSFLVSQSVVVALPIALGAAVAIGRALDVLGTGLVHWTLWVTSATIASGWFVFREGWDRYQSDGIGEPGVELGILTIGWGLIIGSVAAALTSCVRRYLVMARADRRSQHSPG